MSPEQTIIKKLTKQSFKNKADFDREIRKITGSLKMTPPKKSDLIEAYQNLLNKKKIKRNLALEKLLTKAAVRTGSGVSVITVLTKPFKCPGTCIYCPTEPNMPKSYLSNEPAAQRAKRLKFDPIKMVQQRIAALEANGHQVDKIELLILGGSFTAYTKKYRQEFITKCFYAANTYKQKNQPSRRDRSVTCPSMGKISPTTHHIGKNRDLSFKNNHITHHVGTGLDLSLQQEQKINETARYRIIGITLETRPDEINEEIIREFRQLGCTRVQLGIQHTDNKILKLVKRGHTVEDSIRATRLLKENGFKVDHHYMPDLPGSTPKKDFAMMKKVFTDSDFKPDQIKIYPCVVNEYAKIAKWLKQKKYKPYSEKQLKKLLIKIKKITPPWIRINRLIRDIPRESIIAGNKITNLRQILQQEMKDKNQACNCIRCREIGHIDQKNIKTRKQKNTLFINKYKASCGTEYFISFESADKKVLYGFVRLRLNSAKTTLIFPVLEKSALIRELHVYGQMMRVHDKLKSETQHKGLGKKLMKEAEKIARKKGYKKIAVIAGVGVRDYYRSLGYKLEETYLIKKM